MEGHMDSRFRPQTGYSSYTTIYMLYLCQNHRLKQQTSEQLAEVMAERRPSYPS